jgi:hypothetical protein
VKELASPAILDGHVAFGDVAGADVAVEEANDLVDHERVQPCKLREQVNILLPSVGPLLRANPVQNSPILLE